MKEYLAQSHAQIGLNGEITFKFSATSHKSLPSFPMPARPFELPECRNLHFFPVFWHIVKRRHRAIFESSTIKVWTICQKIL